MQDFNTILQGIFICFGPLALVIIGFIGFAWLTDADVRRRYLRRVDLRMEHEMPEVLPMLVTETTTTYTPAGARVTLVPPTDGGSGTVIIGGEGSLSVKRGINVIEPDLSKRRSIQEFATEMALSKPHHGHGSGTTITEAPAAEKPARSRKAAPQEEPAPEETPDEGEE